MELRTLKIIGTELIGFLAEVEKLLGIKIDSAVLKKIVDDTEDAVSEKEYLIYETKWRFCKSNISIVGMVDEYEPETIWIEINGLSERELDYLRH